MIFRKLFLAISTLWGIVTVLFCLLTALGDPAQMLAGQRADISTIESIRQELGLDQPLPIQYVQYLNDLSPIGILSQKEKETGYYHFLSIINLNTNALVIKIPYLRRSFQTNRPVLEMFLERLPGTMLLAFSRLAYAFLIGVSLGMICAYKENSFIDKILLNISSLCISIPSFCTALLLIWIFAVVLQPFTHLGTSGYITQQAIFEDVTYYHWANLLLPSIALSIRPFAILFQLTRTYLIEILQLDYIRTARSKGISEYKILIFHALPNPLNPILTATMSWLAALMAGAFFIETLFDWYGIGKLTIDSLFTNDYPILIGG